jgi:pimeloyl-ACP methyl ester carboxylesterase
MMNKQTYHPFRSEKAQKQYLSYYDKRAENWPVASAARIIDTFYGQTFIRISGSIDDPALVLLPGAASTSLMWEPVIKTFSENYRVYALDNIYDFGRSIYTKQMKNSKDFSNWLNELFATLELGSKINLMGLSYGGWLTAQYALYFPERLGKIILLAPAATILPVQWAFLRRVILFLLPNRYFIKSMMYWLLKDFVKKNSACQRIVDEYIDEVIISRRSFKFKAPVRPTVLNDNELKRIKMPALFLVGENEKLYSPQKSVRRINTIAPNIEAEIIPNAGHDLLFVQKDMVTRKIIEFLKNQA